MWKKKNKPAANDNGGLMIDCKVKKGRGKKVVNLKGDVTIVTASELRDILLDTLSTSKRVELNLEKVTDVDLSFLQLLCSAHRTSLKAEKSFFIVGSYPDVLKEAAKDAGFPLNAGCTLDCNNSCLWLEGKSQ
jgi:anti-anti-sigma regulatory factor